MKILHVVPTYLPAVRYGGPIYSVHALCRALVEQEQDVRVVTTNVDGNGTLDVKLDGWVDIDGVKVRYFRSQYPRLYYSTDMGRFLSSEIEEYDLVHIHSVFLWPNVQSVRSARGRGTPYVISPRGMLVEDLFKRRGNLRKRMWVNLFERSHLRSASAVHFTSALELQEYRKLGLPLSKKWVIPNGINVDDRCADRDVDSRTILFVGRLNWKKGLDRLIPAVAESPGMRLVLAGPDEGGYQAVLEKLAGELNVSDRVEFTGPVTDSEKRRWLSRALCLVLPSYSENFGNVVLEALAAGCPVLTTEQVGAAAFVTEARAGIVVNGDKQELKRGLEALQANPGEAIEMGKRGREYVKENLTWPRVARDFLDRYRRTIEHPRRN
jgi:glycosyltransferase involved in cell wall biosynthesis